MGRATELLTSLARSTAHCPEIGCFQFGKSLPDHNKFWILLNVIQKINTFSDPRSGQNWEIPPSGQIAKTSLIDCYPSQTVARNLKLYRQLTKFKGDPADIDHIEKLRLHTVVDFLNPNSPPKLAKRILKTKEWKRWMRAMEGRIR